MKILKAIIRSYIEDGEAVGSRTISRRNNFGISAATIRNEMADLEEMGLLIQPYTSSGRVPTDKAYRYYVDNLTKNVYPIHVKEIKNCIQSEVDEIDLLLKNSVRILSQITKYTSFTIAPQFKRAKIKRLQLVPITTHKILLVLVMSNNIVKNVMFRLRHSIPVEQLDKISRILTEKLNGYRIADIDYNLRNIISEEIFSIKDSLNLTMQEILPYLIGNIKELDESDLYADGITNILDYPEYRDLGKAKEFISFIKDKNSISTILENVGSHDLDISIGSENVLDELKNCSIVTATYKINGMTIGKIGVLGPTRMDYKNVISMVKSVSDTMNEIIGRNFSDFKE